ncbi:MAG: GNAT family protein [Bacilli bacterium]|jgi:ribosomal-protein-alanine N-acetyltransferase|nr:GNAT family protein [Bacilli bacterium]
MFYDLPVMETPRLLLREISVDDYKDMYEYAHLSFVGPVAGWEPHRTPTETKTIIQMFLDKKKYGQLGVFAIIYKANQKMIGTLELHSFIRGFKAELGYTIHPDYWGMGIAVEAAREAIKWGFETLEIKRLECSTFTTNPRSRRVCEKLHLTYEGIKKKGYMLYDGTIHDLYCYALTDDDYTKWKES